MTKNSDYDTNTGYICSYDINVAEGQPQDITMSKERLKRDRQVGSIYIYLIQKMKRSNNWWWLDWEINNFWRISGRDYRHDIEKSLEEIIYMKLWENKSNEKYWDLNILCLVQNEVEP